ncbi:hypothetical protein WDW89_07670 [Deltaproteobacteria bacterium TL4]
MEYILVCPISKEVGEESLNIMTQLRTRPVKGAYTNEIHDCLISVSRAISEYHFVEPLELLKVGSFGKKMVHAGVNAGLSITSKVGTKLIRNMEREQLLLYANYLENLFHPHPTPTEGKEYYMSCSVSAEVAEQTLNTIKRLRNDPTPKKYTQVLHDELVNMSTSMLTHYYIDPLALLRIGHFGKRMAEIGVKGGLGIISSISSRLFDHLEQEQLILYADYVESVVQPKHSA